MIAMTVFKHDVAFALGLLAAWVPCAWAWFRHDRASYRDARPHRRLP